MTFSTRFKSPGNHFWLKASRDSAELVTSSNDNCGFYFESCSAYNARFSDSGSKVHVLCWRHKILECGTNEKVLKMLCCGEQTEEVSKSALRIQKLRFGFIFEYFERKRQQLFFPGINSKVGWNKRIREYFLCPTRRFSHGLSGSLTTLSLSFSVHCVSLLIVYQQTNSAAIWEQNRFSSLADYENQLKRIQDSSELNDVFWRENLFGKGFGSFGKSENCSSPSIFLGNRGNKRRICRVVVGR